MAARDNQFVVFILLSTSNSAKTALSIQMYICKYCAGLTSFEEKHFLKDSDEI